MFRVRVPDAVLLAARNAAAAAGAKIRQSLKDRCVAVLLRCCCGWLCFTQVLCVCLASPFCADCSPGAGVRSLSTRTAVPASRRASTSS